MTIIDHKNIKLSDKVQEILFRAGFSRLFNWADFREYAEATRNEIFQAQAIADLFIESSFEPSDFADYEF